jgi:hypothetical protein
MVWLNLSGLAQVRHTIIDVRTHIHQTLIPSTSPQLQSSNPPLLLNRQLSDILIIIHISASSCRAQKGTIAELVTHIHSSRQAGMAL